MNLKTTTALQLRRGDEKEYTSFTGLEGEITYDATKKTIVCHDGKTLSGFPLLKENLENLDIDILQDRGILTTDLKKLDIDILKGRGVLTRDLDNVDIDTLALLGVAKNDLSNVVKTASTEELGLIKIATPSDVFNGVDDSKAITANSVKRLIENLGDDSNVSFGLKISRASEKTFSISKGRCRNSNGTANLYLPENITKSIEMDFSAGMFQGCVIKNSEDKLTVENWYNIVIIGKADGSSDIVLTDLDEEQLLKNEDIVLNNFIHTRTLGSIYMDKFDNILEFRMVRDKFIFASPQSIIVRNSTKTDEVIPVDIDIPLKKDTEVLVHFDFNRTTHTDTLVIVSPETDHQMPILHKNGYITMRCYTNSKSQILVKRTSAVDTYIKMTILEFIEDTF
ncbi:MAG: hypothetical protein JJV93_00065 [Alphaproteobacteria bacterium]|nr:hypothetical protein [Alphaproteobacteria bacterium]MBL0717650.1 hypothetical protein [Alphaproteobacteria bacterium]